MGCTFWLTLYSPEHRGTRQVLQALLQILLEPGLTLLEALFGTVHSGHKHQQPRLGS